MVHFGCDLGVLPAGVSVEHWDDVPAVSADHERAPDVIATRLARLIEQCESPTPT